MAASKSEILPVGANGKPIKTRSFCEKDRAALQKIYLESRKNTFDWMDTSRFQLNDFNRDTDGEYILVAVVENNPVGFISVWEPENFIHNLYIQLSNTGKGVGSALLNTCLNKIGRPASLKCLDKNINAKKFYLSRGWKVVSDGNGPEGKYQLMQLYI